MRILFDECLPRRLQGSLASHDCRCVPAAGWAGMKNGELLALAENAGFQVFLTIDRGIEYRENLAAGGIAVVCFSLQSNRLAGLEPQVLVILGALRSPNQVNLSR